uniref:EXPERA domain-containing protein n=1 Tax=Populus trichocarpa TaxID=3694 RepID=U5GTD3_POPTR
MEGQPHPYAPTDLKLPGYVPNFLTQFTIVSVYGLSSLIWILSGRSRKLAKIDRLLMCWWAFTGLTHVILEGYFVFSPEFYKDKTAHYLAEVCDSRYAARDAATVTVEGVTVVFEGRASLLAVCAIASGKSYSYILQFSVSLGQLYGTAVYFLTAYLEGDHFAASSYHCYVYYIGANASWVVIPSLIAIRCWNKIFSAVQVQGQKKTKSH